MKKTVGAAPAPSAPADESKIAASVQALSELIESLVQRVEGTQQKQSLFSLLLLSFLEQGPFSSSFLPHHSFLVVVESCKIRIAHRMNKNEPAAVLLLDVPSLVLSDMSPLVSGVASAPSTPSSSPTPTSVAAPQLGTGTRAIEDRSCVELKLFFLFCRSNDYETASTSSWS